jgi:hypothetical protein
MLYTITSNGGPEFKSQKLKNLLRQYGVYHRLTSIYTCQFQGRTYKEWLCGQTAVHTDLVQGVFKKVQLDSYCTELKPIVD